jgi:hypothetical protein
MRLRPLSPALSRPIDAGGFVFACCFPAFAGALSAKESASAD